MRLAVRLAILGLALAPVAALSDNAPRVILAQPGVEAGGIARFTVRFSQPMVPLGDPRAAAPMSVDCAVGGDGRWVDQQTWVHDFASALPGGTTCTFKTRAGLKSVAGFAVTGEQSFTVDSGGPVARAVLPSAYGTEIEEDQVFLVAANLPPTAQSVAAGAYCAVDGIGERIPVEVLAPDTAGKLLAGLGKDRWEVRQFLENGGMPADLPEAAAERQRALAGVTALRCRRALPPGRDMALVWGADIAAAGGKRAGADQRFDYTVRKPFTARFECSRVNPQAGCSPVEKAYVRFTAAIPMSQAQAIRIVTAEGKSIAPTFSKEEQQRATVSDVAFDRPLPAGTAAKLTFPAEIKDESGRALVNAERFPLDVKFDQAPPLVKFAAPFGILEAKEGGVLPVTVRNVEPGLQGRNLAVGGASMRVDGDSAIAEWLRAVDKAGESNVEDITDAKGEVIRRVNHTGDTSILEGKGTKLDVALPGKGRDFEVVGIPLAKPGFYVVELASPVLGEALLGRKAPRYVAAAALVTNMAVHFKWGRERSLTWVTSLDSGKPVSGAAVAVTDSCTGKLLARGLTDRSGGLMIPAGLPQPETYASCGESSTAHALMVSARSGDDFSFTLTDWGEGIRPYDFDLPYGYDARKEILHTVFDRALVRQGETIHMKHIARSPVGTGFAVPPGFRGTLKLSHRGSDTQFELPLAIDANGIGETQWTAPAGAPMGDYDLQVVTGERTIYTEQSFRLDEYKLPTMRASVSGPKAALVRPKTVPLDLFVGYLSGGGASNLPVDVRVGWSPRTSAPDGYDNFTFGGKAVTEGVRPLDGDGEETGTAFPPTQTLPATLGADGTQRTSVEAPGTIDGNADMRVEMDYQDANGETLTASRTLPVFASAVQLGVKTDGWLMKQDDLRLRFVALDTAGKPIKGQKVSVAVYSRQVLTARRRLIGGFYAYDNRVRVEKLDASCSATSDAQGLAQCTLDPGVSGEVTVVATTADGDGNVARATRSVWLAGDEDWWFGGDNGDRMDLVPEQLAYKSGETARFQVRMPFREATALVTVEREGVLSSFTTQLSGKDPVVEVAMDGAYAPDVYVSVLAVRGRASPGWWGWFKSLFGAREEAPAPTALVDLSKPAYRLGIAKVKVGWEAHQLAVQVKADRERYGARDTARVAIAVRTPDGKPARSADVAFAAVDQALLQLAPNESWDVLTAMMGDRPLAVLTATGQTQVVGKRHYGRKAVEAGGGGGGDMSALNRENFQPVLLWKGRVALDAQGRAIVPVPLSDALSSFKLVAIATQGAQLFGTGTADIRTAQDLSIYAGMPTLVRSGDYYSAGFTMRNGSDKPMTVTAEASITPRIAQGRPITVTIPAGGAAPIAWNLTAPNAAGTLRWQVSARTSDGRAADRITVSQDVIPAVPVETWAATIAQVGTATTIPITAPAGALPGFGGVDVHLSDTLAPPLAGVRDYMAGYPYNCFEQRLSRIVALGDSRGWAALAGEMPTYQAPDGLLRYFPGDTLQGSEALTAYVLAITAEGGLAIPDTVRTRMIEGLKAVLDGRLRREEYGDVRLQRVAAFAALARAGAAEAGMLGQLGIAAGEMPTALLADYIVAIDRTAGLANAAALRAQAETVLRSRLVYEGSRIDLSDQANAPWWLMSSGDEGTIKALIATLGRPGWQDEGPRMMVGTAMRQRRGHWDTTPANAWGTLAVRKFASIYPAQAIAGTTTLSLGGRSIARGWPLAAEARVARFALPGTPSPLLLSQAGGAGPWASVSVKAAVPLTRALSAGYRLTRKMDVVQARNPGRLTRGDVVRVTLTVVASAERNWVVVSDPVPPGATVIGGLGGQSSMLGEGGESEGVSPAYVERGREAWRGYFAWVPAGSFTVSYTMRLNGAGRFALPASRVEAMYSPDIRAAVPVGSVTVGLK
ncbi:alpha-2-macroglobulin family protein [Sphingomonas radiodurans]|uniref:alpha-2-macroglobulin family protein n=1 Tax=Sphingomonas radiodurans TaxID=2890321 RepID=UPI001E34F318|nr:MG2 domain-containing protein [Sphingomonas radiodurans]WBH15225.1 MG2 domain-containing protein [Sphingomonas radiodurans]